MFDTKQVIILLIITAGLGIYYTTQKTSDNVEKEEEEEEKTETKTQRQTRNYEMYPCFHVCSKILSEYMGRWRRLQGQSEEQ